LEDSLGLLKRKSVDSTTIRQLLNDMTSFQKPLEFSPARCVVKQHREKAGIKV
jgi:hypothetical protein